LTEEKQGTRRKLIPLFQFFATNITRTVLESNPRLYRENPVK